MGCKVAKILKGESDCYISLSGETAPKDWDIAAPAAVLKAAGGMFTYANTKELTYHTKGWNKFGCLIASHGKNHEMLCKIIKNQLSIIDPNFLV